ncbi:MAG TPA: MOSC N-terminal beta barrel domain-containing protein [Steroidobacteraceae bacterium]|nr:MOSC N-terminal beta barrel domain-containing protein [Steroidobacteraceae bacterium]
MRIAVTGLNVYPVKSTRGTVRERVRVSATGLEWDRQWMIVNERGTFLSQRTHPQLARIVPEVRERELLLTAPGLATLSVPLERRGAPAAPASVQVWRDDCTGLDEGSEARAWVSRAVGEPARLVRAAGDMGRVANPEYAGATPAPLAFPDGYPLLVCNEASLAELNERLPVPVPMERFRPNVVVTGLPAWAEDDIDTIAIGPLTLRLVKPCTRCRIPSIDQRSGEPSTDPVPELRKFRFSSKLKGVMFGENAVIVAGVGADIAVGDSCRVTTDAVAARSL